MMSLDAWPGTGARPRQFVPFSQERSMFRRAAVALVLSAGLVVSTNGSAQRAGVPLPAARQADGYRLTLSSTVSTSRGAKTPVAGDMVMLVKNGRARIEYAAPQATGLPADAYMLFDATTNRTTIVVPSQRKFVSMDSAGMTPMLGAIAEMPAMTFTNVVARRDALGTGDVVLGYTTRKIRVVFGYTAGINIGDVAMSLRTDVESESHYSDSLASLDPGFQMQGMASDARLLARNTAFQKDTAMMRLSAIVGASEPGFPMANALRTRLIIGSDTTTTETVMRVTSVVRTNVDDLALSVPAGYTATDVRQVMSTPVAQPPEPPAAHRRR
jgi:hypothetical protein